MTVCCVLQTRMTLALLVTSVLVFLVGVVEPQAPLPAADGHQITAELVRVTPGNPGVAAVELAWPAFDNALTATGGVARVLAYEVQFSVSGSDVWVSRSSSLSGLWPALGPKATPRAAKQRVFTRADPGSSITDGFFRFALSFGGSSPSPRGGRAVAGVVTPSIAFDASAESVKAAVESLEQVTQVQVERVALDETDGAFEWIIVYDVVASDTDSETPLPLLTLYTETLSAPWTGDGDQVAIQSLRSPPSTPARHPRLCTDVCSYQMDDLPAGEAFAFRVRAQYSLGLGWSDWSASSTPLKIPATRLPRAPSAPELLAATASGFTITWRMGRDRQQQSAAVTAELFPVLAFKVQQQCDDDVDWTTVSERIPPGAGGSVDAFWTVAGSLERPPGSSCVFRVAATTANGRGPFSSPSQWFTTLRTAPGSVESIRVLHDPLRLAWNVPVALGGHKDSDITYEVDYRATRSSTWSRLGSALVDSLQRTANLSTEPLESYTRYVARVRAVVEVGSALAKAGPFTESSHFLTDFAVDNDEFQKAKDSNARHNSSTQVTQVIIGAVRDQAANRLDHYYFQLTSGGGTNTNPGEAEAGQPGVVLVFPVTWSGERLTERAFFFTGESQSYRVPLEEQQSAQLALRVVALDVYAWGGGGAGASSSRSVTGGVSNGGGGAFARGVFQVSSGDVLEILVGGGGYQDGRGGFNGGGNGGTGEFPGGGGGGGASEVRISGTTVLVAAGGGGAGSSDYCCAHGGGGGSLEPAEAGLAADADTIPLDLAITGRPSRDEYHSANVAGDIRDASGLPAKHQHLDWGFAASSADYSVLATGGLGASVAAPGLAGTAGSFQYSLEGECLVNPRTSLMEVAVSSSSMTVALWPSNGQRGRGGSGQSGKQGGGGGGGGFFGGGGGGAGIDGAGGGGGSSFVAFDHLFDTSQVGRNDARLHPQVAGESVDQLELTLITSSSVRVSWKAPKYGFAQLVQGFVVEMANRSANEDFRVLRVVTLPSTEVSSNGGNITVDGLAPTASYRFRIKPLLRDGRGSYSSVVTIRMPPEPKNVWEHCATRSFAEENTRAGMRFTDAPPLRRLPSARRGHSLTPLDDALYLFGGMAQSYACNKAHKVPCLLQEKPRAVSNELWRYDLLTSTWWEVPQTALGSVVPLPREKHSMAVIGDRLLLFGGRTDDAPDVNDPTTWGPQALNDLWELSVSSSTARETTASLETHDPMSLHLLDGGEAFALGKKAASSSGEQLCVANLTVSLQLTHACPHKLRLQLFGPGPATLPGRQQTFNFPVASQAKETTWSDTNGLGEFKGDQRATATTPSTRAFPAVLQSPDEAADRMPCTPGTQTFTFSSSQDATQSVEESAASLESLSIFHHLPVAGNWTLSIADVTADGLDGTLDSWDVLFDVAPCIPGFTWTNLSAVASGTPPTSRFQHTVVIHQSSMFVFGGTRGGSGLELRDLHRLDFDPSSSSPARWVQLTPLTDPDSPIASERRSHAGRTTLLTPYQLMALGRGLQPPRNRPSPSSTSFETRRFEPNLSVLLKDLEDPLDGWRNVGTSPHAAGEPDDELLPVPRYWGATAFVKKPPHKVSPRAYLFGGQDDTILLDDLWSLEMNALHERFPVEHLEKQRENICAWRLENAAYQSRWETSCGASTAAVVSVACSLETLVLHAWCEQTYQSITI